MLKKDYIQRQLEEFGKVLASLLRFKKDKDWEEFEKELARALTNFTTLELEKTEVLTEEAFQHEVIQNTALRYEQKKILANILFEKMDMYLERKQTVEYLSLKSKCLALYLHLQADLTQNEFDMEVHYRIALLSKD